MQAMLIFFHIESAHDFFPLNNSILAFVTKIWHILETARHVDIREIADDDSTNSSFIADFQLQQYLSCPG